jgi:hypothetical protein
MPLRRYAPLGRCMYCLVAGVKLSEEHLIPKSLGGRLTLRDAVCEPCRIRTGRLEQATLDRDFVVAKTLLALKRRRARAKGPGRLATIALVLDEAEAAMPPHARELTASDYPRGFSLPAFEPAGLLCETDRTGAAPRVHHVSCRLQLGTAARQATAATPLLVDPHAYGYSLAKWAYGYAMAERGLDCCDTRAIRQLLAAERHDVFNFVGSPSPREGGDRDVLHRLSLRQAGDWLTVVLGLLASSGMPPYEVVIGKMKSAS